jgi:8-oxo-dGTP pyrophosphatase MutT (NUDIX family)
MTDTKGSHDRSNHGDHRQGHHPPRGSTLPARQCTKCWWFLPGGHVEPGEGVEALVREISEEIGTEAKITGFVGVVEHGYREDGVTHHELNLGFEVAITEPDPDPVSQEDQLEFHGLPFDQLADTDVRPGALKHALLATGDDRAPFWHSWNG